MNQYIEDKLNIFDITGILSIIFTKTSLNRIYNVRSNRPFNRFFVQTFDRF